MAKKRYDVCIGQEGKDNKTHWKQIGVVLQTDKGFSLRLEMIPTGWDGWAQLFEPKAKDEQPAKKPSPDDDIPF